MYLNVFLIADYSVYCLKIVKLPEIIHIQDAGIRHFRFFFPKTIVQTNQLKKCIYAINSEQLFE